MKWLKYRKNKIAVSLAAGMAAMLLVSAVPESTEAETGKNQLFLPGQESCENIYAWWGTMYPKFCFSRKQGEVKISFWLAKVLDW